MNNIIEDLDLEPDPILTQKERHIAGFLYLALIVILALYYFFG